MFNNLSISIKSSVSSLLIGAVGTLSVIVGVLALGKLYDSTAQLHTIDQQLIYNEKIVSSHHKYTRELMDSLINKKQFHGTTDDAKCLLGDWYFKAKANGDFISLPQNIKDQFTTMESAHKEIHNIANIFILGSDSDNINNLVFKQVPQNLDKVISALTSYNKHLQSQQDVIKQSNRSLLNNLYIAFAIMAIVGLIAFIIGYFINRDIVKTTKKVENGLQEFFQFLKREKSEMSPIEIKSTDELGQMGRLINSNVEDISNGYLQDSQVIEEVSHIVEKAQTGIYSYNIKRTASNPELETLRNSMNEMLTTTNKNLNTIVESLIAFGNANFKHVTRIDATGNIGSLTRGTNALGASISEILAMIANTADILNRSADQLASTSEELSTSANEQASSLEETAASIEEITSTIRSTADKAHQMGAITEELKNTSHKGNKLASDTAHSMDEINSATNEIEEAITIIDQIAFQTNILSLNAAVEAATAGEAGKGFAVVAGEVRNLAARSAEAANEIKSIVEKASSRASQGKVIADEMMNGYLELNDKIETTTELVKDVENASKEQMRGMDQINGAITQLDQTTQENAAASHDVSAKATELSSVTDQLVSIVDKTQYDESKKSSVCDIELAFDTTKLKLDHIAFKETNFKKIGEGNTWKVATEHDCNLGKWIDTHKHEVYASSPAWQELLKVHAHVHSGVQDYIDTDAKDKANKALMNIAKDIESDTSSVFELIDELKKIKCQEIRANVPKTQAVQIEVKKPVLVKPADKNDDEWDSF